MNDFFGVGNRNLREIDAGTFLQTDTIVAGNNTTTPRWLATDGSDVFVEMIEGSTVVKKFTTGALTLAGTASGADLSGGGDGMVFVNGKLMVRAAGTGLNNRRWLKINTGPMTVEATGGLFHDNININDIAADGQFIYYPTGFWNRTGDPPSRSAYMREDSNLF